MWYVCSLHMAASKGLMALLDVSLQCYTVDLNVRDIHGQLIDRLIDALSPNSITSTLILDFVADFCCALLWTEFH